MGIVLTIIGIVGIIFAVVGILYNVVSKRRMSAVPELQPLYTGKTTILNKTEILNADTEYLNDATFLLSNQGEQTEILKEDEFTMLIREDK